MEICESLAKRCDPKSLSPGVIRGRRKETVIREFIGKIAVRAHVCGGDGLRWQFSKLPTPSPSSSGLPRTAAN